MRRLCEAFEVMPLPSLPPLAELCDLLRAVSRDEILRRFRRVGSRTKGDGSPVTEADLAVQARVAEALRGLDPARPLLGEEMPSVEQEALLAGSGSGFWCLDPLDGTSNFAAGFPLFAISLALIWRGDPLLGIVYDPVREECFAARRGGGCWLNGERLSLIANPQSLATSLGVVDFKRLDPQLGGRLLARPPVRSLRNLGSVALEWSWLAAGRFAVYLHGGQRLWDYAAGSLLLAEAGGAALLLDAQGRAGTPPDLAARRAIAATTPALLTEWCAWLDGSPSGA